MVAGPPASLRRTASSSRARTAIREGALPDPGTGVSNQRRSSVPRGPKRSRWPGGTFRSALQGVDGEVELAARRALRRPAPEPELGTRCAVVQRPDAEGIAAQGQGSRGLVPDGQGKTAAELRQ